MAKKYWVMKNEPNCYSIDDLKKDKKTHWDGIRNYQARNIMRDDMKVGDVVVMYHSSCSIPGAVGLSEVTKEGYPDFVAKNKKGRPKDPKHTKENPIWYMVDIKFKVKFKDKITLDQIKFNPKLEGMMLRKRGVRLSVQPVTKKHFDEIIKMSKK
jgi:predicted RNA-binding protein with PUA-like domain